MSISTRGQSAGELVDGVRELPITSQMVIFPFQVHIRKMSCDF